MLEDALQGIVNIHDKKIMKKPLRVVMEGEEVCNMIISFSFH
jgi:hypothetical protein